MATIKKKPTKAHKSKKVVKAHMGMAHVPRQRPPRQTRPPKLVNPDQIRIKQPTGSRPLTQPVRIDQPTGRPRPITPKRIDQPTGRPRPITPKRRPIDLGAVISPSLAVKPMDERARRRRDNALKSELDEAVRQANRRPRRPRRPRRSRIATELPVRADPFGGTCPSPDTLINLSGNKTKQAGKLAVGDMVYTQHENTLEWGDYTVSHVSIISDSERLKLVFDTTEIVCSLSHKMYVDNKGWTKAEDMQSDDVVSGHTLKDIMEWEAGNVVKITVEDAHSYIAAGLLSHNKTVQQIQFPNQPTLTPRFNPLESTALTDRFTKQQQELVQAQNQNNLNQNRLQMQRNKGGDVKKYAVGGLNKGMTKSRTKYGIVDNKKK